MSFSDRKHFVQAGCRNMTIACERTEPHTSRLRRHCEGLIVAVDGVAGELVGDAGYIKVVDLS